jgi:nucleotide-binding universal stress UspA family protein
MNRFKNILYVSEPLVEQTAVIERAVTLAENNQAKLTVIGVIPSLTPGIDLSGLGRISDDLQNTMVTEHQKLLETSIEPYRQKLDIHLQVKAGKTVLEVIRAVLRDNHDLVIKPAEDIDWLDMLFGSDDMHLLRKCPCPIWLIKPGIKSKNECILAAVDFDPWKPDPEEQKLNQEIIELSTSLALSEFSAFHLLHVWNAHDEMALRTWSDNPEEAILRYVESEREQHKNALDQLLGKLRKDLGKDTYEFLSPKCHLLKGEAKKLIPQTARDLRADLVVMGTIARTGIPGILIGNTAEIVLDQLQCSVLALKPAGFVSPIKADE